MPPKGTATPVAVLSSAAFRIGVICAAKGHCDFFNGHDLGRGAHRSDMCRQRALRLYRLFLSDNKGYRSDMCRQRALRHPVKACNLSWIFHRSDMCRQRALRHQSLSRDDFHKIIGVICAAKGHCDPALELLSFCSLRSQKTKQLLSGMPPKGTATFHSAPMLATVMHRSDMCRQRALRREAGTVWLSVWHRSDMCRQRALRQAYLGVSSPDRVR